MAYALEQGGPVMADDSGLVVQALPNQLGIHTARFGGEGLSSFERNKLLINAMSSFSQLEERSAYFICVLCFYFSEEEFFFFEGRLEGNIDTEIKGEMGFGYDPVFIPTQSKESLSLAMLPSWKREHSHRALACQHAQKFFKERVGQN